jgi:quinol monooxygenase YgiN
MDRASGALHLPIGFVTSPAEADGLRDPVPDLYDVDPEAARATQEAVSGPAVQTLRDYPGCRGLTVIVDEERRTALAITLWTDVAALDAASESLSSLKRAVRLAFGASHAERHSGVALEDVRRLSSGDAWTRPFGS